MEAHAFTKSAVRVGTGILVVLAIPFIGMALSDEVAWSVGDFVLAALLLGVVGTSVELAARRAGNVVIGGAVVILGVLAAMLGEVGDAPGLVLLGALLIAGGGAIVYRRVQGAH